MKDKKKRKPKPFGCIEKETAKVSYDNNTHYARSRGGPGYLYEIFVGDK